MLRNSIAPLCSRFLDSDEYIGSMPRPKGLSKTGGRVRGTPNKRTSDLGAVLQEFFYDPARALLEKYQLLTPSEQLKVDLRLMDFVYPRSKLSEDVPPRDNGQDGVIALTSEEREKEVERLMAARYNEDDQAVLGDLELIKSLRPELLRQFICGLDGQSTVDKK